LNIKCVQYNIIYIIRKAIKDSVIVVHLVYDTIDDYEPLNFDFIYKDIIVIKKIDDKENE